MTLGALLALALIPAFWPTGAFAGNDKIDARNAICAAFKGTSLWGQCTRAVASGCAESASAHPRCERWANQWFDQTGVVAPWLSCDQPDLPDAACTVFVTSETYDGNLGGIEGADEKCQRLADTAHLGGTFLAWISDSGVSPSTSFTRSRVPYRLPGGETTDVASDWDDLADGTNRLDHAIDRFESGSAATGEPLVWTATGSDGRPIAPGPSQLVSCDDWSSGADDAKGAVGCSNDLEWTITSTCMGVPVPGPGQASCSSHLRLYCFQQ